VGLSPSISRGWLPLKLDLPPRLGGDAGLELSSAAVAKPRAHPKEVLFDSRLSARSPESIEGVILHGTFPQVFTALFTRQTKDKNVFLLIVIIIFLNNNQSQFLLLEI